MSATHAGYVDRAIVDYPEIQICAGFSLQNPSQNANHAKVLGHLFARFDAICSIPQVNFIKLPGIIK